MLNKLSQRFGELLAEAGQIEAKKTKWYDDYAGSNKEQVDKNALLAWKTKARHLLVVACGESSQHFQLFTDNETGGYRTSLDNLRQMAAVLRAAQSDFDGGYFQKIQTVVQADLFGSELDQATELLKNGYKVAAAVIAGVVLETAIRELCKRNQIPPAKLARMNDDLAKAGVYNAIVQKRVTYLSAVRNAAAHGDQDEFGSYDVTAMIGEIEQLLANQL